MLSLSDYNDKKVRVFLHADQDSVAKKVFEKLGFREVGRRYEYLSAEIGSLTAKRKPSG